jgi:ketosteroid isomerase-like protein
MRIFPSIILLSAVATMACAHSTLHSDGTAERERQLVLAAEDAYAAAEVNRDEGDLRRLVDDQFVYNGANGTTSGKEELIRSVLRMNMTGQTISERSVILQGEIAVIFGTTELHFQDPNQPGRTSRLRYTSVYVKREGAWRLLALQMQPRSSR